MLYENNPANLLRDIVRKLNLSIKINNRLKIKRQTNFIRAKLIAAKRHIYTPRGMCVQYENNPANA